MTQNLSIAKRISRDLIFSVLLGLSVLTISLCFFGYQMWSEKEVEKVREQSTASAQLFLDLARFGDIRYSKFLVLSFGKKSSMKDLRVFDSTGMEVQSSAHSSKINIENWHKEAFFQDIKEKVKFLGSDIEKGAVSSFIFVQVESGQKYILMVTSHLSAFPWLIVIFIVGLVLFLSLTLALYSSTRSARSVAVSIDSFTRGLEPGKKITARPPFSELIPVVEVFEELLKQEGENVRNEAIANTTHMLAHDVRKPFSTIQLAMNLIRDAKSYKEIQEFMPAVEREIGTSLASVNGLIQDVMEMGGKTKIEAKPTSPKELVRESLEEVVRVYPEAEVNLSFDWKHDSEVKVDPLRIKRVFSNIFANAIQAMRMKGNIFIRTSEKDRMVQFTLGNEGSFIPEESLEQLFEAFYTKGKSGGTGLGLAIAKKLVEAHGGEISVRSSEEQKTVEFTFTLPSSGLSDSMAATLLPSALSEYAPVIPQKVDDSSTSSDEEYERLATKLDQLTAGRRIIVGILDDEKVYRQGVVGLFSSFENVEFKEYSDPIEMLCEAEQGLKFDFFIADIELKHEADGFDAVKHLREICKFEGPLCFHSNRSGSEDISRAMEVGANSFLPKPMTREHLLKFITDNLSVKALKF